MSSYFTLGKLSQLKSHMKKIMTVGYKCGERLAPRMPTSKIVIANRFLEQSGFNIGNKMTIEYLPDEIIIRKIKSNL